MPSTSSINVLHLAAGNMFGGVETFLLTLARERSRCPAMASHFALCFEGRLAELLREQGAPVHLLGKARLSRPWTVAQVRSRLSHLLTSRKFDVAVCHSSWPLAVFGRCLKRHAVPIATWVHDSPNLSLLARLAMHCRPDLAIANSRYTQELFSAIHPHVRSSVIPYPVSLGVSDGVDRRSTRARLFQELAVDGDPTIILLASRMEAWKGHRLLLESLHLLRTSTPWECWIAGGPQRPHESRYFEEIKDQAKRLGIQSRVRFLGFRDDVRTLMAAADVFCQPNLGPEPFGIVFIEALDAGLPVVTTKMGGPLDIVDDQCGMLTRPADPADLCQALKALVESRSLRGQLSKAAPARALHVSGAQRRIVQCYEALSSLTA